MTRFMLHRLAIMALTALCLTFVVFFLTNLHPNLEKMAKTQVNTRMSDEEVERWLDQNGYSQGMLRRYGEWLGVVPGWTAPAPAASAPGDVSTRMFRPKRRRVSAASSRAISAIRRCFARRSAPSSPRALP
jgi:hypothetical protein